MIIEFLNELKSEYLEKKYDLEAEKSGLKIKLDENSKFIQRLNEESEQNYNAFSPRSQNARFQNSIKELENERQALLNQLNEINDDLENINFKLKQIDIVLQSDRKEKASEVISNYKLDQSTIQKIESVIHKLDFCSKIVLTDHMRCKMEISNVIKILYEIFGEMNEDLS